MKAILARYVLMKGCVLFFNLNICYKMYHCCEQNGQIPLIVNICQSPSDDIWLNVLLAYKSIYLLIGLLLASQTYNVKIKRLRDSRLIVVSVFAIIIISVVLTIVGILVTVNPDALYALLALFILSLVTGVQVLLFLPRVSQFSLFPSNNPGGRGGCGQ